MLVGASYTLFRMRKNLITGIKRGRRRRARSRPPPTRRPPRTERDLSFRTVLMGIAVVFVLMIGLYFYFTQGPAGRHLRRDRHAGDRLLLRRRLRQPRRHDRLLQQPDLRPDPGHHHRGRAHDGHRGREGGGGRRRRARRGRGRLRLLGGGGRDAAGPQGRPHPRRHAVEDAGRRHHRRRRRRPRPVLPALPAAHLGPRRLPRQRRLRRARGCPRPRPGSWPRSPRASWAARWPGRS